MGDIEKVLILDFGSQYTQLIARRVRESRVYSEILSSSIPLTTIASSKPKGILLSGGPASVYGKEAPLCDKNLFNLGIPVLGICYGMQLMTYLLGGEVRGSPHKEYGPSDLAIEDSTDLFAGMEKEIPVWMSHGDRIDRMPPGFVSMAHTKNSPTAAMKDPVRKLYALQFHPEVFHTPHGPQILKNFLYNICQCRPTWTMKNFSEEAVEKIRATVGPHRALSALSGGVDSAVATLLTHKAIGPRLTCLFVDTGLLRLREKEQIQNSFEKNLKINIKYIDASSRFIRILKGVTDPEKKRKVIGREFIRVFEEEGRKGGERFLVQGTLYPDVIESQSFCGPSVTIKSHHNVGGLPRRMRFRLLEPLRELFKDEVRELGRELGLPEEIVSRRPFPGPGLAIRILGEVTEKRLAIVRAADAIVTEEIERGGQGSDLWQFFAVLLPVKTVGVMGDGRTYESVVAIRAVTSSDGMTADWARLDSMVLGRISTRIINEVPGVNRVVYDISSKPPATIEWE